MTLADYHANDGGGVEVFGRAIQELPSATSELLSEAWAHPGATMTHAAKTVVEAGVMGTAIGYLVPARGPASILVGVALTAPMAYHAVGRLSLAQEMSRDPLADQQAIAHLLARDAVSGTADLGLSFVGGYAGAELGYGLARSQGALGKVGQATQRGIMRVENRGLTFAKALSEGSIPGVKSTALPKVDMSGGVPKGPGGAASELINTRTPLESTSPSMVKTGRPSVSPERLPFGQRTLGILNRRAEQLMSPVQTAANSVKSDGTQGGYQLYMGSLHGHSRYSDGMGLPKELYGKAKAEGYDFMAVTDHNHVAARGGVKPGDARHKDQSGSPTVAEEPILYAQTFADAAAASKDGKFIGLVGIEMGTIGKVGAGHKHDDFFGLAEAPAKPGEFAGPKPAELPKPTELPNAGKIDISVKSPINSNPAGPEALLPNVKEPVGTAGRTDAAETPGLGRDKPGSMSLQEIQAEAAASGGKNLGGVNHINLFEMPIFVETIRQPRSIGEGLVEPVIVKPQVEKIPDGDFKTFATFLDGKFDTTGGTPVIQLNHPRYRADENPNLPRHDRARDYGQKAFRSKQEWLDRFVDPYVRQIELIKGGALSPNPVDVVAPGHIDATSFAGYLDKGVHASPTFGRDFHYGDPGGNPGATGIMAKSLDKPALMDALRERRTIATTSGEKLTGSMWGNDKHPMGSILDQAVIPELTLSARIGGEVVADAKYTVKLWGDTKLGDKKLAAVVQETTMTGAELMKNGNQVSFDPVNHKLGNKAAYYMEIQRTDPGTGHVDKMWTAPIWVEPLTGDKHSFYMRWLTGNSAQFLEGQVRGK